MALWRCDGETGPGGGPCNTLYAVGLSRCPRCHSTDFHEEGSMPKITRHGGPSDATTTPEEEVPSSPGTSSPASTAKPQTKSAPKKRAPRSRARTTGNPSPTAPTGSSSAASTAGDPTAPTSETTSNE